MFLNAISCTELGRKRESLQLVRPIAGCTATNIQENLNITSFSRKRTPRFHTVDRTFALTPPSPLFFHPLLSMTSFVAPCCFTSRSLSPSLSLSLSLSLSRREDYWISCHFQKKYALFTLPCYEHACSRPGCGREIRNIRRSSNESSRWLAYTAAKSTTEYFTLRPRSGIARETVPRHRVQTSTQPRSSNRSVCWDSRCCTGETSYYFC